MIYLDTSVIIRLVEGRAEIRGPMEDLLSSIEAHEPLVCTSRLSLLECRCKPLREGNANILSIYDEFFASDQISVREIDALVIDKATEFRARLNLKTPDAIHAATAVLSAVESFWTTDSDFIKCSDLSVQLFAS